MDFYSEVTAENAKEWYTELPAHLRKVIDQKLAGFKPGRECSRKECADIYEAVEKELGVRPVKPADPTDPLDGWTHEQAARFDALKAWGARYDELLLMRVVLEEAQGMQKERKMLSQALGLDNHALPDQGDGLDDSQAATVRWIQNQGMTPLEFLVDTYKDEEVKMSDRLAAARSLLDYVHKKVPAKQEVETKNLTEPKLDPKMLRGLNEKELALLESLLKKMAGE